MLTITADDVLPVHMADALTGEAPFWDEARGTLWWIDIQGQRLLGFEPASGRMSSHRLPLMPGFVVSFAHHGLVLGLEDSGSRMTRIGKNELCYGDVLGVDELLHRVDAVTDDDVAGLAGELLHRPRCLTVVGPFGAHDFDGVV